MYYFNVNFNLSYLFLALCLQKMVLAKTIAVLNDCPVVKIKLILCKVLIHFQMCIQKFKIKVIFQV